MLRESQNFFFHLMAKPETIGQLKKNRAKTLKRFFRSEKDRKALLSVPFERLETYRKHVSIGLLGGIESAFPVLRSLVSQDEWNGLLNEFYLKRLTRSPIARQIFREFSNYLQKKYRGPLLKRLPYLKELAEYENLDIRILYDVDRPVEGPLAADWHAAAKTPEELLSLVPVLNPHQALRVYAWPVHRICKGFSTAKQVKPGRVALLVYRDPETLSVRFLESNPLVADLVGRMTKGEKTVGAILEALLKKHKPADPAAFVREGIGAIDVLKDKGVVLGFRTS
ncbi:MAG TPA: putative DNA-binding domain-containing protein [bacterium]|nr:putative DNA-binding domain-containing protein [bacterium]